MRTRCFDVTIQDLEVRGFVKGAEGASRCSLGLACEGVFAPIFHDAIFFPPQFKENRTEICNVKDRVANTEHGPLAFEC